MRLIDADHLTMLVNSATILSDGFKNAFCKLVDGEPTVSTSSVRYGQWEGYTYSKYYGMNEDNEPIYRDGTLYYCSECRRRSIIREKYCPACGARMDTDESEPR